METVAMRYHLIDGGGMGPRLFLAAGDWSRGEVGASVEAAISDRVGGPSGVSRVLELEGVDIGEHVV